MNRIQIAAILVLVGIVLIAFGQRLIPKPVPIIPIEQYVRENISVLSPIKEQLGGQYYVTYIEAQEGKGTVYYEDGHNAYIADFVYHIDAKGFPLISSFKVTNVN